MELHYKISGPAPQEQFKIFYSGKAFWVVATSSIGAVEALKDQGICRWNHSISSLHQHANNTINSFANASMFSASSSNIFDDKLKKSEELMMEKVVNLGCLGPRTVRF
ncbi:hypothetical protein ACOSQ3_031176 [Xanthoceras sorbifolium]